jgi:phosphate transport system substrate-binding protein
VPGALETEIAFIEQTTFMSEERSAVNTPFSTNGRRALAGVAASAILTAAIAACGGHGSASNSVLPTTGAQSTHVHPDTSPTPTDLYGGGASLPAPLYRQDFDYYGVALPPDSQGQSSGLPVNARLQFYYSSTSSSVGRGAFLAQTSSTTTPASKPIYCPNGVTTCYPYPLWHFSASDSIFSSTEQGCYYSGCTNVDGDTTVNAVSPVRGQYIQVPFITESLPLAYNPTGGTYPVKGLNLDRHVLCGIWEGAITAWNDPGITEDNGGVVVSTNPIIRIVRSDSAGTTALLTAALVAQCTGLSNPAYDWTGGTGNTVTWPNNTGNVLAYSGNSGIVTGVTDNTGAIGYVGPSYIAPVVPGGLPAANVQDQYQVTHNQLHFVAPSVTNTLNAFKGINPPTNSDPYDLGISGNPNPEQANAYPIVGWTWIEAYQCYNTTNEATGISDFIKWYSTSGPTGSTAADKNAEAQGLAPITQNWKGAVHAIGKSDIVKGPISGTCTI